MHLPETYHPWIYAAAGLVCYLVVMLVNPARQSLRDGFRCLFRYPSIWMMLALFGLCYAVFQIQKDVCDYYSLAEGIRPVFQWSRPWFLPHEDQLGILKESRVPALVQMSGLFNVFIITFPFSAVASILFLLNWEGHHAVLLRALRRRFDGWGWVIYAGIIVCALAALVKPLIYGAFFFTASRMLQNDLLLLQCMSVIDALSFLFEIMFGIYVQIYLMLMVYAWVRGLKFTRRHLLDFAIRRFSVVMKWAAVGMVLSTIFINLPLIIINFPQAANALRIEPDTIFGYLDNVARPGLAAFFVLFSAMQIILTFHSESLGKALKDMLHFFRKDAWAVAWYLVVAYLHFYVLTVLDKSLTQGLGSGTALGFAWRLSSPLLSAVVGGWLLASWVCLYKRSEAGRVQAADWIKY